jgi:hypothetical protein
VFIALLLFISQLLVRQWCFKAASFSILVLNAKGGEIKGQSNRINYHLGISKIIVLSTCFISKPSYCKTTLLWEKGGGVFGFWSKSILKNVLIYKTKCFDIEVRKWICFVKTNQVVANDPNIPNPRLIQLVLVWSQFAHVGS